MDMEGTEMRQDWAMSGAQISVLGIVSVVVRRRKLMIVSVFVSLLIALFGALRTEIRYTASGSFQPHEGDQQGSSQISSLAQQFGVSMPTGGAQRSLFFYSALLESREILGEIARFGVPGVVGPSGATTVDLAEYFEIEDWPEAERVTRIRTNLSAMISVSTSRDIGVIEVSARSVSAELSAAIVRRLFELISEFDQETRQSQAAAEGKFAQDRLRQLTEELSISEQSLNLFLNENRQFANSPQLVFEHDRLERQVDMRQQLVTSMAQAFEQARIDEVRNTPVITIINQPEPPALRDPRGRVRLMVLGLVLGVIVGLVLIYARELFERRQIGYSEEFGELKRNLRDVKQDLLGLRSSTSPTSSSLDSNK